MRAYRNLSWLYGKGAMVLRLSHEELVRISKESKRRRKKGNIPGRRKQGVSSLEWSLLLVFFS